MRYEFTHPVPDGFFEKAELEVVANLEKATKDTWDCLGEPATAEVLTVYLSAGNERVDITALLSSEQIDEIADWAFESAYDRAIEVRD